MASFPPIKTCHNCLMFLLSWLLLYYSNTCHCIGIISSANTLQDNIQCPENERDALLQFKHDIKVDHCGLFTSWHDHVDCCQWHGVHCSNHTGHVISLYLSGAQITGHDPNNGCLEGIISSTILELKHLKYLDLSFNNFQGQPIPSFIGSLTHLEHLNLSHAGFSGVIPHHLGNLSRLTSLDLSCELEFTMISSDLQWLSRVTKMININLSGIDLSKATTYWFQLVNNLPSLRVLHLDNCYLTPTISSSISYVNSSSNLRVISLSYNRFHDTSIFQWLFNLSRISTGTSLVYLDLCNNRISGPIPTYIEKLHFLSYLDLGDNLLEGQLPSALGNMHNLLHLSLMGNRLEGPIPDTISSLKYLTYLDLSANNFQGSGNFPKSLGRLCSIQEISLSSNNITDEFSIIIESLYGCAHKSLLSLDLSVNQVWGSIPDIIVTFSSLRQLVLFNNQLNGTISEGIGQLSMLEMLSLTGNQLKVILSHNHFSNLSRLTALGLSYNPALELNISDDWIPPFQLDYIDLSSCKLGSRFPRWLLTQTKIVFLDISNTEISDTVPTSFWYSLSSAIAFLNLSHNKIHGLLPNVPIQFCSVPEIDLSSNYFTGKIPSFLRNSSTLSLKNNLFTDLIPFLCPNAKTILGSLDVSNNLISGKLPDCWMYFDQLSVLHLENNHFSGSLPASIGALKSLIVLHLRNNSLSGELPISLEKCTSLVILDLAYNSLAGYIPPTIGLSFASLGVLSLRHNNFVGPLPSSLCQLSHLQILDLSINHISGTIPKCIYNLTAMTNITDLLPSIEYQSFPIKGGITQDIAWVMWKRKEQSFMKSLGQVKAIDISHNELQGRIPDAISNLTGLVFLNLSRNHLNGSIPSKVGQLTSLEFLDLSSNHLSGEIPTSLAQVSYLEILDLSNNSLSGKIPLGTQLQGFDPSSYMGNPGLCGAPLQKCPGDHQAASNLINGDNIDNQQHKHDNNDIFPGLYISVVLGFIVGFWGVCGTLVLKASWRHAFFRFFDDTKDRIYLMVVVNIARAWNKH